MGDRALIVCVRDDQIGPAAVYTHWGGHRVKEYIEAALPRMRWGDLAYSTARLCGVMHELTEGHTGLGIMAPPAKIEEEYLSGCYTHRDAGVFILDVKTFDCQCFAGYGFNEDAEGVVMDYTFDRRLVPDYPWFCVTCGHEPGRHSRYSLECVAEGCGCKKYVKEETDGH